MRRIIIIVILLLLITIFIGQNYGEFFYLKVFFFSFRMPVIFAMFFFMFLGALFCLPLVFKIKKKHKKSKKSKGDKDDDEV